MLKLRFNPYHDYQNMPNIKTTAGDKNSIKNETDSRLMLTSQTFCTIYNSVGGRRQT